MFNIIYSNNFSSKDAPAIALYESKLSGSFKPPLKSGINAQLSKGKETVPCTKNDLNNIARISKSRSGP